MWLPGASWAIFTPRGLHPGYLLPLPERNPPFSGYLLWRLPWHACLQAPAVGMLPTEEEITLLLAQSPRRRVCFGIRNPQAGGARQAQNESEWSRRWSSFRKCYVHLRAQAALWVRLWCPRFTHIVDMHFLEVVRPARWWLCGLRPALLEHSSVQHSNHLGQEESPI